LSAQIWVDGSYLPRGVDGTCLPRFGLMEVTCPEGLMVLVCPDFLSVEINYLNKGKEFMWSLEFLSWLASGIPC